LSVGPLLAGATYYWRVNSKNAGGLSAWSEASRFSTVPPAPGAAGLSAPSNGATNQPLNLSVAWNAVAGASAYRMQLSTAPDFATAIVDDSAITSTSRSIGPLSTSTAYYWRVRAKNAGGAGTWSETWSFTTIAPAAGAPVPSSPSNSAVNQPLNPSLAWSQVSGATSYRVQVSTDVNFAGATVDDSLVPSNSKNVGPLSGGTTYYWRVNAQNSGGASGWSEIWCFTTLPPPPGAPSLVAPASGAADVDVNPVMCWNRTSGAALYCLQVASDSLFTAVVSQDSALADTSRSRSGLINDTRYYWRVCASNAGGTGPWSAVFRFTTIVAVPSIVVVKSPASGDTVRNDSVFLTWFAGAPKIDRYWVEYSLDSTFSTLARDTAVTDTVKLFRGLQNNHKVWWHVMAHNCAGWGDWSATNVFRVKLPTTRTGRAHIPKSFAFSLSDRTRGIRYALPNAEYVSLRLYNVNGKMQSELVGRRQEAGYYSLTMHGGRLAAGTYLAVFKAGSYHKEKMMFLMK
jgi:hypothetical protein